MKVISKEFNALTGEETITERDETAAEKKEREQVVEEALKRKAEAKAKATAKAALLAKLGITAEEAVLLLS
jgi:hypothetical protein